MKRQRTDASGAAVTTAATVDTSDPTVTREDGKVGEARPSAAKTATDADRMGEAKDSMVRTTLGAPRAKRPLGASESRSRALDTRNTGLLSFGGDEGDDAR